jgi:hypothetical protein
MRCIDARGTLLSPALDGAFDPSRQAGKGVSIVLIDRQPLTANASVGGCRMDRPIGTSSRSAVPWDLLNASLSNPHIIIFSIGAASVADPDVLGKITLRTNSRSARAPSRSSSGEFSSSCTPRTALRSQACCVVRPPPEELVTGHAMRLCRPRRSERHFFPIPLASLDGRPCPPVARLAALAQTAAHTPRGSRSV